MNIEVDDVQRSLSRAFDLQGGFPTSVVSAVSPVIVVGPGGSPPYDSNLRYARADTVSGDATHPGIAGLVNPSTSGFLFLVDSLHLAAQASIQNFQLNVYYGQNAPTIIENVFTPNVPLVDTDTRQRAYSGSPLVAPNLIFESGTLTISGMGNTIVLGTVHGGPADADVEAVIARDLILVPNTGLFFGSLTNTSNWWFQLKVRQFPVRQK